MNDVLIEKLNNIKNCIDRIESKKPFSVESLKIDFDLQDVITLNLQRLIQSSVDMAGHICAENKLRTPNDMADSFQVLYESKIIDKDLMTDLMKAVGLRNILVHEYSGLDWQIIHNVANVKIEPFRKFMAVVLKLTAS
jgi:uncharacterized protein YutE (UPF0331/DUF86 family)